MPTTGDTNLEWYTLSCTQKPGTIEKWIYIAPIWTLPEHFSLLEECGATKIVALSSTSRYSKAESDCDYERSLAARIRTSEEEFITWCEQTRRQWTILRPTMIYGHGQDKNISEIARFIKRFGIYPVFGKASGLRQPVHVDDVAEACLSALDSTVASGRAYNLSGGETLTYREMLHRIFGACRKKPRLIRLPMVGFNILLTVLKIIPRFRRWSAEMVKRMNQDLTFDNDAARHDLKFSPRPFTPDHDYY